MAVDDPAAPASLAAARRHVVPPTILAERPNLTQPSAETVHLKVRDSPVFALAVLLDGRLACGSKDGTIRLWDPRAAARPPA
jgi:hypothetical protein